MPDIQTIQTVITKRYQCRHIHAAGHRCGSPALRHEELCYYHHTTRRPAPHPGAESRYALQQPFDLPLPEDRGAIQISIGEILRRIALNAIDPRRAGLLLYGLQIASLNLPRIQPSKEAVSTPSLVEEITLHPTLGTLAPTAEVSEAEEHMTLAAQLLAELRSPAPYTPPPPYPDPYQESDSYADPDPYQDADPDADPDPEQDPEQEKDTDAEPDIYDPFILPHLRAAAEPPCRTLRTPSRSSRAHSAKDQAVYRQRCHPQRRAVEASSSAPQPTTSQTSPIPLQPLIAPLPLPGS